jgi:hypothetical protein
VLGKASCGDRCRAINRGAGRSAPDRGSHSVRAGLGHRKSDGGERKRAPAAVNQTRSGRYGCPDLTKSTVPCSVDLIL